MTATPNPTQGTFYLGYPAEADGLAIIEIFDPKGSLVFRTELTTLGLLEIDASRWEKGIYIASLRADDMLIDRVKIAVE